MSYGTPVDSGTDSYLIVLKHNATGIIGEFTFTGVEVPQGGQNPSRATKDAVFQAAVTALAALPGTTLLAARRQVNMFTDVTP